VIEMNDTFLCWLIADCVENGFGLQHMTRHMNAHLVEMVKTIIPASSVFGVQQQMKPKMMTILNCRQGNTDNNSVWAKARLGWYLQLLILCFGDIEIDKLDELAVTIKDTELVIAIRYTYEKQSPCHFQIITTRRNYSHVGPQTDTMV
jgi:hypothetical protein